MVGVLLVRGNSIQRLLSTCCRPARCHLSERCVALCRPLELRHQCNSGAAVRPAMADVEQATKFCKGCGMSECARVFCVRKRMAGAEKPACFSFPHKATKKKYRWQTSIVACSHGSMFDWTIRGMCSEFGRSEPSEGEAASFERRHPVAWLVPKDEDEEPKEPKAKKQELRAGI